VDPTIALPVIAVLVVVGLGLWVFSDARARQGTRREVTVTIGSMHIDRPEVWTACCLVVFVVFFPLYLVARRESE
jgi:hypothetical protein